MKHFIFLLFMLPFTLSNPQNDSIRAFDFQAYESEITTINFIVLDINFEDGLVAFKHVYEILGFDDMESVGTLDGLVNCNYSGMEKHPFAGVILGVYDLNSQSYDEVFHIYQSVSNEEDCLSFDESEHNLEFAKEYFLSKKLNIMNKPKAIPFIQNFKNNILVLKPENITVKGNSERFFLENDDMNCIAKATLTVNNNVIYTMNQKDRPMMASRGNIMFISAYRKNNKIIFLERFHHMNNSDGQDKEFFNFTKIYNVSEFK